MTRTEHDPRSEAFELARQEYEKQTGRPGIQLSAREA